MMCRTYLHNFVMHHKQNQTIGSKFGQTSAIQTTTCAIDSSLWKYIKFLFVPRGGRICLLIEDEIFQNMFCTLSEISNEWTKEKHSMYEETHTWWYGRHIGAASRWNWIYRRKIEFLNLRFRNIRHMFHCPYRYSKFLLPFIKNENWRMDSNLTNYLSIASHPIPGIHTYGHRPNILRCCSQPNDAGTSLRDVWTKRSSSS